MAIADQLPEGTDQLTEESIAAPPASETSSRIAESVERLRSQASEKAFAVADQGKEKATNALEEIAKVVSDAAATVDEKVGPEYGDYARRAADAVSGVAASLRDKDVETLYEDARSFVAKSPAIALGAAVVLGFALARLARAAIPESPAKPDAKPE
jgi:hypothetical protein